MSRKEENTKSEAVPEIVKTNAKDHHKFKTVLCLKWETYGGCPYGKKCRFAHGKSDLKPRPKIATENYKTKLCRNFESLYYCSYGTKCMFIHPASTFDKGCCYEKMNNMKSTNPNDLLEKKEGDRLPIFQHLGKLDSDFDSDSNDLESMSTNDEQEKNYEH